MRVMCPADAFSDGKQYLTAGRTYPVTWVSVCGYGVRLIDDTGEMIDIYLPNSSHTRDLPWAIVEDPA